jgi:hypothetical protein
MQIGGPAFVTSGHAMSHPPQCAGSLVGSTHAPSHSTLGAAHAPPSEPASSGPPSSAPPSIDAASVAASSFITVSPHATRQTAATINPTMRIDDTFSRQAAHPRGVARPFSSANREIVYAFRAVIRASRPSEDAYECGSLGPQGPYSRAKIFT